jgi:hypothetical protein
MSRTRRRLDETRFFLNLLKDSEKKHPDFDYFLSAFTSAARSVTWVLKAEFVKVPGWQEWYESQSPDKDEKELLGAFTSLRNKSQKEAPLETKPVVVMDFPPDSLTPEFKKMLEGGVGKQFQATFYEVPEDGDMSKIPATAVLGVVRSAELRLEELGERDVLDACAKYFAALERLVDRCEAEFAA